MEERKEDELVTVRGIKQSAYVEEEVVLVIASFVLWHINHRGLFKAKVILS